MVGDVPGCGRITLGADKAFDVAGHVAKLREMNVTPHVAARRGIRNIVATWGCTFISRNSATCPARQRPCPHRA